ncbi:oxidoreductase [Streptomyces sp. NPDC059070]|uniref:oxidoreductase n=1 Tax=Streptomyces sp. NPDC059070 TaxID=3346713 RepID=UPI0036A2DC19
MTSTPGSGAGRPVDLLVVGAGPAGVAAAMMAAGLRMRVTVVEADAIGSKVAAIGALENVPGGWTTGPELAAALAGDLDRHRGSGRLALVHGRATGVTAHGDRAEVTLADGRLLVGAAVVVATGVTMLTTDDVSWVEAAEGSRTAPLWRAAPERVAGREVAVLGADRPLGTWLRAHPSTTARFHVLHPASDGYKTEEVADDDRVRLHPVERAAIALLPGGAHRVTAFHRDGTGCRLDADVVLTNLGSRPAAPKGLAADADGYCPQEMQHPRVLVAGDLKGARMQRIAVAIGDGARAALTPYYGSLT